MAETTLPRSEPGTCEWCAEKATYRVFTENDYERFACSNFEHRVKTERLGQLDHASSKRPTRVYSEVIA